MIYGGLLLLPLCSCSFFEETKETVVVPSIAPVGRVEKVNVASKYVFIRRYGSWNLGDQDILETRGDGRTGNLLATGEKLGEHVAADIRSGDVQVGDAVFIRRISESEGSQETAVEPQ